MSVSRKISVQFNNINITSMSANSGIFTGENSQSGWQVNSKENTGFGSVTGYQNLSAYNVNIIDDSDFMDACYYRIDEEDQDQDEEDS
jgi:glutamate dehydrogenase/leucine dehydrogenase